MSKYSVGYALQANGSVDIRKFNKAATKRTFIQKVLIALGF